MKKLLFIALPIMVMICLMFVNNPVFAAFNYGEAIQKSIWFYEAQRSGKLPADNRVSWRGDSTLGDGADAGKDLTGGWFDAGDHVKFGLPMAYSVSMLSWSVYEYKSAFVNTGQLDALLANIRWGCEYLIKCHTAPNEFYYQVGNGSADHSWWGPAEVIECDPQAGARPSYKVTASAPGSTVTGETAAALAAASIIFKNVDANFSAQCLTHAQQLFAFADTYKGDSGYTAAKGFYDSWSGYWDELSWAGAWLYLATGDAAYLDKADTYSVNWPKLTRSTEWDYKWAHCWDSKTVGASLLLARIFSANNDARKDKYISFLEKHLAWWTTGTTDGQRITYTPGGLAYLDTWGPLRYATTTAFIAFVYGDWAADPIKKQTYQNFAAGQVNYALGNNPNGMSYIIGIGGKYPQHPHHRTAHGSWTDRIDTPAYTRHILYGGLVGGPDSSDIFSDDRTKYQYTEVACDYNAGLTGALAKMCLLYGGSPQAGFPPRETPENEIYTESEIIGSSGTSVTVHIILNNKSAWPARKSDKLTWKYFVDLTEVYNAGYTVNNVTVKANWIEGGKLTQLLPWDESKHIYYAMGDFTGVMIAPAGIGLFAKNTKMLVTFPTAWNNSNDWSYQGLNTSGFVISPYIPVYDNGVLIFGQEPSGVLTTPGPTPTPTTGTGPGNFNLISPANRAGKVPLAPSFDWEDSTGAESYTIMVDNNSDFSSPEINKTGITVSNYGSEAILTANTKYYWKVIAVNSSGSTPCNSVFYFTTAR